MKAAACEACSSTGDEFIEYSSGGKGAMSQKSKSVIVLFRPLELTSDDSSKRAGFR